jgi:predicted HTH domain antitoxin
MSLPGGGPEGGHSAGPFSFINHQWQSVISLLEGFTGDIDQQEMVDMAFRVLDLPPEERFTDSVGELGELFGIDDPDNPEIPEELERLQKFDQNEGIHKVGQFVIPLLDLMQEKLLEGILNAPQRTQEYAVFAAFIEELQEAFEEALKRDMREVDDGKRTECVSRLLALNSWLILIGSGEQTEVTDEMLRDILRSSYYGEVLNGKQPSWNPEELSLEDVRGTVRLQGALIAYENLDISVSRGAEIANLPVKSFEEKLRGHDLQLRYGPATVDDLNQGTGLRKSDTHE